MISEPVVMALNVCALTVILLTVNLLVLRSAQYQAYLQLALCLICIGFIIAKPMVTFFMPAAQLYWLVFSLPSLLLIAPSFWFYVKGITHETPWRFKQIDLKHFYLAGLGLFISLTAVMLPQEILYSIIADDGNSAKLLRNHPAALNYWINFLLIFTFILILIFMVQSAYYCLLIFKRLNRYNDHLKDLFASTENRELRWLRILLITVGGVWLFTAANIVWDNTFHHFLFHEVLMDVIILIMIWSVSIWGLRQKPGFEEVYNNSKSELCSDHLSIEKPNKSHAETLKQTVPKKYERSALDQQQAQKISEVIIDVMQKDQLFLDNELSLQKLAKHIDTPANYISQTLNTTIGMNFFDFVNQYRIEQAKMKLANSSLAVIDIAFEVGFNAKSSFYKAFKKATDMTPSGFRKHHRLSNIKKAADL